MPDLLSPSSCAGLSAHPDQECSALLVGMAGTSPAMTAYSIYEQIWSDIMEIFSAGSRPTTRPNADYFTGSVSMDPIVETKDPARVRAVKVRFEPGARTAWHTHPLGQTLYVVDGVGWVRMRGGPRQEIRPGDTVWIPPAVVHWHGATATTAMTHIAIHEALDGSNVKWMEKVSDGEYEN